MRLIARQQQFGFTLIELVVGIVLTTIALTFITNVFFSNPGRSVEPLLQIRASEFGKALMDEILSKKFDELTPEGGFPACTTCSAVAALGTDAGEARASYDDVDDYDDSCGSPVPLSNALGDTPANFDNYSMEVCVIYDGIGFDGVADANTRAKRITVNIYPPAGSGLGGPIVFSAYKGNY